MPLMHTLYNTLLSHPSFKNELASFLKEDVERLIESEENSNSFGLQSMVDLVDYWNQLGQNFKRRLLAHSL